MTENLQWHFSPNPGGSEHGYSDSGIETFRDKPIESVARETIQNSLDAGLPNGKPVKMVFQLHAVSPRDIPALNGLTNAIERCLEFYPKNKKANKFFQKSLALAKSDQIDVLTVSDHNTCGLEGGDFERGRHWNSLVRAMGASSKNEGEGGSFGIGASAPFATSSFRTVLYSTKTKDTDVAFVGVSRLTTHEGVDGTKLNPNGHLGIKEGHRVENVERVPAFMRRNDTGTTIGILGLIKPGKWKLDFAKAVLSDFWPAIHFGRLEIEIGEHKINKGNLNKWMELHSNQLKTRFVAHEYLKCVCEPTGKHVSYSDILPTLGPVTNGVVVGF